MGLNIYAGLLTRHHLGSWQTIIQQAAADQGLDSQIVRDNPDPEDVIIDPGDVFDMVVAWREQLGTKLGVKLQWPEATVADVRAALTTGWSDSKPRD